MADTGDELRRVLAARAGRVRSTLSGPAIRARAEARRHPVRRYAPLVSAASVLVVLVVSLVLLPRGPGASEPGRLPTVAPPVTTTTTAGTVTVSPRSAVTATTESPSSTITTSGP
ncbi:hypothetical protein AB0I60_11180 [Actinosynnema sp. NPDC050436]|uniref:hypothetical protein n=1 Tax=Actinosynnema sp. NPDC050436 TaxID=3155659 RepID=UPI0033CAC6E8